MYRTYRYHNVPLRESRDRMSAVLFKEKEGEDALILHTFPISDLAIYYIPFVIHGREVEVYILGAQEEVTYQLCDEDGKLLSGSKVKGEIIPLDKKVVEALRSLHYHIDRGGKPINIPQKENPDYDDAVDNFQLSWKRVARMTTPLINEDTTYRILATSNANQKQVYLNQEVFVRVGINTELNVEFLSSQPNDIASRFDFVHSLANYRPEMIVNYDRPAPLQVKVIEAEKGMAYQLYKRGNGDSADTELSVSYDGQGGDLILETDKIIPQEDIVLYIRTWRDGYKGSGNALMDGKLRDLHLWVRPNPKVGLELVANPIQYEHSVQVKVTGYQNTARYTLFKRILPLEEYHSIEADQLNDYLAGRYQQLDNFQPADLEKERPFSESDFQKGGEMKAGDVSELTLDTGALEEDSLLIVKAEKLTGRGGALFLVDTLIALVEPNKAITVETKKEDGVWKAYLTNTQKGVSYQLNPVGNKIPGFHPEEKGIGGKPDRRTFGMRVGVDFQVASSSQTIFIPNAIRSTEKAVILPIGEGSEPKEYEILAVKSYNYVSAILYEKAVIQETAPVKSMEE